jgi:hypothetical protein
VDVFFEREKNPFGPGGSSLHHHLWPVAFHLKWSTDWELKYLPPTFEIVSIVAVGMILLHVGLRFGGA